MSNKNNSVLYTGVTNNLVRRTWQYKQGVGSKFTSKYKVNKLVYFEIYNDIIEAIKREKQIKAGSRKKKMELICKNNPDFEDLYPKIIK